MRKHILIPVFVLLLLSACLRQYERNPDSNHTHADFAVWMGGNVVDFSVPEFMSGLSVDDETHDEQHEYLDEHLHLHDAVGHVIHRHKPGLRLDEFFASVNFHFETKNFRMFITNPSVDDAAWKEMDVDLTYVFNDMDMILITDSIDDAQVTKQKAAMTQDACKYSKTCPWKGKPPAENCIADPAIPCVVPEDDL